LRSVEKGTPRKTAVEGGRLKMRAAPECERWSAIYEGEEVAPCHMVKGPRPVI